MNTTSTTSMDTIKLEKLQAMKRYRRIQLFQTVFQYCLTFMVVILCLSKSVWFMSLCSAIKAFFLFTLPCVGAYVMTPTCLFVVCNVIVIILVGESKMVGSASSSSSSSDLYDDYVRQIKSRSLKSVPVVLHQVGQQKLLEYSTASRENQLKIDEENDEENEHEDEEKKEDEIEEDPQDQKEDRGEEEEEREDEEEEDEASEEEEEDKLEEVNESNCGEEEDNYLLTEELNRRVEDFIARVNRQRRIEADMLLCGG